jgi:hypothetical protein
MTGIERKSFIQHTETSLHFTVNAFFRAEKVSPHRPHIHVVMR